MALPNATSHSDDALLLHRNIDPINKQSAETSNSTLQDVKAVPYIRASVK